MPTYMTPEEVADELKVTRRTVYRWLSSGRLRGLKAGDLWRIRPEDLQAFLEGKGGSDKNESGEHTA